MAKAPGVGDGFDFDDFSVCDGEAKDHEEASARSHDDSDCSVYECWLCRASHLRASQINGCSVCVDMHPRMLKKAGETDERLFAVAAWRDAPYFSDAERAALALTEAVTRLSDRADPVPDEIWDEAARHYDEKALAALVIEIALINVWNRFNVTTRQVASAAAW